MAAARILLLGDDAAKWTSGSWWGLSTCCVRDAAVQPEPPHPGGSGWLDWLLQSESGPVGETWVKKISFHQLPETLHLFSFGDCQCDNSQWKGCVCKWRKRIPEMQRQEGRCGWVSSGVGRPRRRHGRGGERSPEHPTRTAGWPLTKDCGTAEAGVWSSIVQRFPTFPSLIRRLH